jgi:hypothetical protein
MYTKVVHLARCDFLNVTLHHFQKEEEEEEEEEEECSKKETSM